MYQTYARRVVLGLLEQRDRCAGERLYLVDPGGGVRLGPDVGRDDTGERLGRLDLRRAGPFGRGVCNRRCPLRLPP